MIRIVLWSALAAVILGWTPVRALELVSEQTVAEVLVPPAEPGCVVLAAQDLIEDVQRITGKKMTLRRGTESAHFPCVLLASADRPASAALAKRYAPEAVTALRGRWEAYRVLGLDRVESGVKAGPILLVAGSDKRGTMFGLYAFIERFLGVDPLHFWTDRAPAPRATLAWDRVALAADEPTFRYRGWFINDEDLLTEWHLDGGKRDIDYPYYARVVSPKVSSRIFEAMLRLRLNLVIPASFVDIRNPDEARLVEEAARRGLFVTMHHIEPLGVSGFGFLNYYRDLGEKIPYAYLRHPDRFERIWKDYAKRWSAHGDRVIWQLGLRGIADRPVWASDPTAPKTPDARGAMISKAMETQMAIAARADARPAPPATTTLWMEGSDLHAQGHLKFPPGVAVIFADRDPGFRFGEDFEKLAREPGRPYGIYYHLAFFSSGPHLVQAVSPQRLHGIFRKVAAKGDTHYAILNVSNVREFVQALDASARLLRDVDAFDPDRFLLAWCRERFGDGGAAAEGCYRAFFGTFVVDDQGLRRSLLDGELAKDGKRALTGQTKSLGRHYGNPAMPRKPADFLEALERQRDAVAAVGREADDAAKEMAEPGRRLFEVNLIAQQRIQQGLLAWAAGCLRYRLALEVGAPPDILRKHLQEALAGMAVVREGQALASRGEKWKYWYRGERKVKLGPAEEMTRGLLRKLEAEGGKPSKE